MTGSRRLASFLALVLTAGCGGGAPDLTDPGTPPPHGGTATALPGGEGFVEIVKGKDGEAEYLFYFLKDMKTPYTPGPTEGNILLGNKQVDLVVEGDHLATPKGPALFPQSEPSGDLRVRLNGKGISIPLNVR